MLLSLDIFQNMHMDKDDTHLPNILFDPIQRCSFFIFSAQCPDLTNTCLYAQFYVLKQSTCSI